MSGLYEEFKKGLEMTASEVNENYDNYATPSSPFQVLQNAFNNMQSVLNAPIPPSYKPVTQIEVKGFMELMKQIQEKSTADYFEKPSEQQEDKVILLVTVQYTVSRSKLVHLVSCIKKDVSNFHNDDFDTKLLAIQNLSDSDVAVDYQDFPKKEDKFDVGEVYDKQFLNSGF